MVVQIGDNFSNHFRTTVGVRQGGVCSPKLFSIYVEDALVDIEKLEHGVQVGHQKLEVIAYADDILLISTTRKGMQVQLDALTKYGIDFDIKWNPLKTEYIIFNKDLVRSKEEVTNDHWLGMPQLSNEIISEVEQFRYLGVWISNKNNNVVYLEKRRNAFFTSKAKIEMIGLNDKCIHPYTRAKLFKIYYRPVLTYGWENFDLKDNEISSISKLETNALKDLMGISRKSHHTELLAHLAINRTKNNYLLNKLKFFKRLKANTFTGKVVDEMINSNEMRENHNLFSSQISLLIADTAKTIIVKHSREMGIGHPALGRWDTAYSEKTATVIERCNMRIDELTNELIGADISKVKIISDTLAERCSFRSTKLLNDLLMPEKVKSWINLT